LSPTTFARAAAVTAKFSASLLREAIEYDYKFPLERKALERELANLNSFSAKQFDDWLQGFAQIRIFSPRSEKVRLESMPRRNCRAASSYLWTTHQLDIFRTAAIAYADRLHSSARRRRPPRRRFGITVVGQGVASYDAALFRKLRPHGAYYSRVSQKVVLRVLLNVVARDRRRILRRMPTGTSTGAEGRHTTLPLRVCRTER